MLRDAKLEGGIETGSSGGESLRHMSQEHKLTALSTLLTTSAKCMRDLYTNEPSGVGVVGKVEDPGQSGEEVDAISWHSTF